MKQKIILGALVIAFLLTISWWFLKPQPLQAERVTPVDKYWFLLERKSNKETLFQGEPGNSQQSQIIKIFPVKVGIPGERPTPLPDKLGREYWLIVNKFATPESPETAPYFLTLDIPYSEESPYGPTPYEECNGQCNWQLPGSFGLHGIASDSSKLATDNPGSSGCIRHSDEDISFLYNLLNPVSEPIRYYIKDI